MMAILKKLFSALFGFLGGLLGLGKKSGYYLELDEAKSVSQAPAPVAKAPTPEAPVTAPEPAAPVAVKTEAPAPNPLNLPAPTVTTNPEPLTVAPEPPAIPYFQFSRRRPGANMKGFLELAKQVKTPI